MTEGLEGWQVEKDSVRKPWGKEGKTAVLL